MLNMTVVGLLAYTIGMFGLAYIIGRSRISEPIRYKLASIDVCGPLVELLECVACAGFWLGLGFGTAHHDPGIGVVGVIESAFTFGIYTCGANFLLGRATGLIGFGEVDQ